MKSHRKKLDTSFQTLKKDAFTKERRHQHRTFTDWLIEFFNPTILFVMVFAVMFFLLDIRYVFTEVHDTNLRIVTFFFIMGVVALNRLVARDGAGESFAYIFGLVVVVALYTFLLTSAYGVGAIAGGFMKKMLLNPYTATVFNLLIVGFIWWLVNRLTHECCVDENTSAGDIGILTGTARRFRSAMRKKPKPLKEYIVKRDRDPVLKMNVIEPYDPSAPKKPKPEAPPPEPPAKRMPKRHPGISIFYFSVPVLFLFSVGLRVIQQAGPGKMLMGQIYMGLYTTSALSLLMLTSLAGLRQFFRGRRVQIPAGIGPFWISLGLAMVAIVLVSALYLPRPGLPPMIQLEHHETDFWTQNSKFEITTVEKSAIELLEQSKFMDKVGKGVLITLILFILYGALRGFGGMLVVIGRRRKYLPEFLLRFFSWLDKLIEKIARVPSLPKFRRRRRISRAVATSLEFKNPMDGAVNSPDKTARDFVEHAYSALCALAYDMGVPREVGATPYEFIKAFPKEMSYIRDEAMELTEMYVHSAYSPYELDARTEDRLRKFWVAFDRLRNRVVH